MATYDFVDSTGVIQVDTAQIQADVEAEYRGVFGEDFIVDPETPEGVLIAAEVTSRQSVARNNAKLANQINPSYGEGLFLDAVYALFGGERDSQARSLATCVCTGVAGTTIPVGARARSVAGDVWLAQAAGNIGGDGTVTLVFESEEFGPILASANSINQIVDNSVLGWETVTNPTAATAGVARQSDSQTRIQRNDQLALQSRSTPEAIAADLPEVDGYQSHQFRENTASTAQVIDGINMVAHSIWVAVAGGSDEDVANALALAKTDGAGWNGSTTVSVTDPFSMQTSDISFQRPTAVPIAVRVTVRVSSGADITNDITQSVLRYAAGEVDGERGFVVGGDVSPFEIGSAVNVENDGVFVRSVEISENPGSPTFQTGPITIDLDEIPTVEEADIDVVLL